MRKLLASLWLGLHVVAMGGEPPVEVTAHADPMRALASADATLAANKRLVFDMWRTIVNAGRIGPTAQKLYDTIVAIQYGEAPDPHGWTVVVGSPR